jgi:segregation and condensation protein A
VDETSSDPDPGAEPEGPPPVGAVPTAAPPPAAPPRLDPGVCAVELPEFEGPLDLLLHLVRRHELDILDIPIAFVCEKYLAYIDFMRAMDLEVAGDYLVMAATLAYLKSRELVPHDGPLEEEAEGEEGGPDPRDELVRRLLEYQKYRDAADRLDLLPVAGRDTFSRGQDVEMPPVDAGLAPITLFRLAEAYHRVLEKARILKSHEVVLETFSVAQRMQQLTVLLVERDRFDFEQIFLERAWSSEAELRSALVVTLMSILELVRLGVARVHQPIGAVALEVERCATPEEAERALAGYDEAASFGAPVSAASSEGEGDADDADDAEVFEEDPHPLSSAAVIAQDAADVPADPEADAPEDPPERDDPSSDG